MLLGIGLVGTGGVLIGVSVPCCSQWQQGVLQTDVFDNLDLGRNELELFARLFADRMQVVSAAVAGFIIEIMHYPLAGQFPGQWFTFGLLLSKLAISSQRVFLNRFFFDFYFSLVEQTQLITGLTAWAKVLVLRQAKLLQQVLVTLLEAFDLSIFVRCLLTLKKQLGLKLLDAYQ